MNETHRISAGRLFAGFAAGAAIPILTFIPLFWPAWHAVLVIGALLAALLLGVVGIPVYLVFRRFGLLNIYTAVLLGGILCTLPLYYFSFYNAFTTHSMIRDGTNLIVAGRLTFQGFLHLFIFDPLWLFVPGALGGLIGWLVAAGFRTRAS